MMFIALLLLGIFGFLIYKMFRPIFKIFFAVAMVMLVISVAVAAIKDGLGIEDEIATTEKTEYISEENLTLKDYLTGVDL